MILEVKPVKNNYRHAKFAISATTEKTLPPELGFEVAFAGRSNAGKSSSMNVVCQQKSLARTSKTPGRTQLINFFSIPEGRYLVDLPGYGYAKVPEKVKLEWQGFIESYLNNRWTLTGIVLVMDVRHPLKEYDQMMLKWAENKDIHVHILLNKVDKLKRNAMNQSLFAVKKQLKNIGTRTSVQLFSAHTKEGLPELLGVLDSWMYPDEEQALES